MSSDGVVKFWDVRTKACINEVKGLEDAFTLAWAPDGQTLVVGNKVSVQALSTIRHGLLMLMLLDPSVGQHIRSVTYITDTDLISPAVRQHKSDLVLLERGEDLCHNFRGQDSHPFVSGLRACPTGGIRGARGISTNGPYIVVPHRGASADRTLPRNGRLRFDHCALGHAGVDMPADNCEHGRISQEHQYVHPILILLRPRAWPGVATRRHVLAKLTWDG